MPLGLTASLKASVGGASVPLTPPTCVTPCTVTFTGSALVGDSATLDVPGEWTGSPTLTYQWLRNGVDIIGALGESYTLTEADADQTISLRETATNGGGQDAVISSNNVIPAGLGAPTVASAIITQTGFSPIILSLDTVSGTTGNPPAGTDTYQWQADTDFDSNFADLPGETASTITAPAAGRNYQLVVTRTNPQGSASTTSNTVPVS